MSDESPESFDAEYVKDLRKEAARYRTQSKDLKTELEGYKGLEAQISEARVENELIRRGVTAQAEWVSLEPDQSPAEAVDKFLEKYPMFTNGEEPEVQPEVEPKVVPTAMSPKPTVTSDNSWEAAGLDAIRKDPVAKQNLTEVYRDLLKTSSNQTD